MMKDAWQLLKRRLTAPGFIGAKTRYLLVGCLMLLMSPELALAAAEVAMPWDSPLKQLQASLTGPVALAVSIVGVAICGAALVFGGELSEFTKRMVMLVLAISILMGASTLITTLFVT